MDVPVSYLSTPARVVNEAVDMLGKPGMIIGDITDGTPIAETRTWRCASVAWPGEPGSGVITCAAQEVIGRMCWAFRPSDSLRTRGRRIGSHSALHWLQIGSTSDLNQI